MHCSTILWYFFKSRSWRNFNHPRSKIVLSHTPITNTLTLIVVKIHSYIWTSKHTLPPPEGLWTPVWKSLLYNIHLCSLTTYLNSKLCSGRNLMSEDAKTQAEHCCVCKRIILYNRISGVAGKMIQRKKIKGEFKDKIMRSHLQLWVALVRKHQKCKCRGGEESQGVIICFLKSM